MGNNVVVAQSGGPTPVINNSLRSVIETCRAFPDVFGTIYAGWHGIEGVLKEELLNLSAQDEEEIQLLRHTPAAGSIGTCRYKLREDQQEDFERIIDVFKAHDIGYFFYIGGNDSMDTANKVSKLAGLTGLDLVAVGIPKTIDNDIGDTKFKLIDHTPGYGSVARYWMNVLQCANEENAGSSPSDPVLVLQAMGRKIGYIPAAARLADPERQMPLQIYLAESKVTAEELTGNVNDQLKKDGRCIIVLSEGFDVGDIGESRDGFGHLQYSSAQITAAQKIVNLLNNKKLAVRGVARGQAPGTDQRSAAFFASPVDLEEAYHVAKKAVLLAKSNLTGYMATIIRQPGPIYGVDYSQVSLYKVANSERKFPKAWIAKSKTDVTDEFVAYAQPLVGADLPSIPLVNGRARFTRFKPIFADKKCPEYVMQALRT